MFLLTSYQVRNVIKLNRAYVCIVKVTQKGPTFLEDKTGMWVCRSVLIDKQRHDLCVPNGLQQPTRTEREISKSLRVTKFR